MRLAAKDEEKRTRHAPVKRTADPFASYQHAPSYRTTGLLPAFTHIKKKQVVPFSLATLREMLSYVALRDADPSQRARFPQTPDLTSEPLRRSEATCPIHNSWH